MTGIVDPSGNAVQSDDTWRDSIEQLCNQFIIAIQQLQFAVLDLQKRIKALEPNKTQE